MPRFSVDVENTLLLRIALGHVAKNEPLNFKWQNMRLQITEPRALVLEIASARSNVIGDNPIQVATIIVPTTTWRDGHKIGFWHQSLQCCTIPLFAHKVHLEEFLLWAFHIYIYTYTYTGEENVLAICSIALGPMCPRPSSHKSIFVLSSRPPCLLQLQHTEQH